MTAHDDRLYLVHIQERLERSVREPDAREIQYGVYYTQKKPLTSAALEGLPGI